MAKRSPLSPGAYGKPQRWHQILTQGAQSRAAQREAQRRKNAEAAETAVIFAAATTVTSIQS